MNSGQLEYILSKLRFTKKYFIGVFASNNIPNPSKFSKYPYCFVANTDRAGSIGEHWVACFVSSSKQIEYFDSLGDHPNQDLSAYLNQYDKILYNKRIIQFPQSDTCGHFCIYFLTCRCSGTMYCEVMDTLYKTRAVADFLVKSFVRNLLRL